MLAGRDLGKLLGRSQNFAGDLDRGLAPLRDPHPAVVALKDLYAEDVLDFLDLRA